ncbi:MAG: hypothetical protein ABIE70_13265 [bacterium]
MKSSYLAILSVVMLMFCAPRPQAQHYFGGGNAIALSIDSTKVTIRLDDVPIPGNEAMLQEIGRIELMLEDDHTIDKFVVCSLQSAAGYFAFLDSLDTLPGVDLVEPYYPDSQDSAFLVGYRLCVGFDKNLTQQQIDSINSVFKTVLDHPLARDSFLVCRW